MCGPHPKLLCLGWFPYLNTHLSCGNWEQVFLIFRWWVMSYHDIFVNFYTWVEPSLVSCPIKVKLHLLLTTLSVGLNSFLSYFFFHLLCLLTPLFLLCLSFFFFFLLPCLLTPRNLKYIFFWWLGFERNERGGRGMWERKKKRSRGESSHR